MNIQEEQILDTFYKRFNKYCKDNQGKKINGDDEVCDRDSCEDGMCVNGCMMEFLVTHYKLIYRGE